MDSDRGRSFDLNIVDILEAWAPRHGVRELIANALDEQALTGTADVTVDQVGDRWIIRDHGRGLRHEHLAQNESQEKLANPGKVIGKFGVGLKDAIAALHRHGVSIALCSAHAEITVIEQAKHGFDEVRTLHALVRPSPRPTMAGTEVALGGIAEEEVIAAKNFFRCFSGEEVLGQTPYGSILRRQPGNPARIYVNGGLVAEDDQFVFSYDITSLNAAMRRALNRERTNVGRTAFADRVKSMLLASTDAAVAEILAAEIAELDAGEAHDEVKWTDVAVHACKILNTDPTVVFVSSRELADSADAVDHARAEGRRLVMLPHNIRDRLRGATDPTGAPVRGLDVFVRQWSEGFTFAFLEEGELTDEEREVFAQRDAVAALVGGWPRGIRQVLVSATMRPDARGRSDALGLCDFGNRRIIIRRDQLASLAAFAGTLLHELVHAQTRHEDVTRAFEDALTERLGEVAARALKGAGAPRPR
jgi:hypothetical protein